MKKVLPLLVKLLPWILGVICGWLIDQVLGWCLTQLHFMPASVALAIIYVWRFVGTIYLGIIIGTFTERARQKFSTTLNGGEQPHAAPLEQQQQMRQDR